MKVNKKHFIIDLIESVDCERCCEDMTSMGITYENIKVLIKEGKIDDSETFIDFMTEDVFILSLLEGYNFYLCLNCGWFKFVKHCELENKTSDEISNILQAKYNEGKLKRNVKRK